MMDKIQYDSFYKFLVSIGVILIIAPLFALNYIISGTYNIILSKTEYNNLSNFSLNLINMKLNCLNTLYSIFPIACILLIIIGLICLLYGCKKWSNIQKNLDEITLLDIQEKKLNIEKMSTSEIIEKAIKEDAENQEDMQQSTNSDSETEIKYTYNTAREKMLKALQIEDACYKYIKMKLSPKYILHQNVKVENHEFDIIASSKYDNIDLLYEIKYWRKPVPKSAIIKLLENVEKRGVSYENNLHRNFKFIIIIVSTKEGLIPLRQQLEQYVENYTCSFIKFEVIDESTLNL